MNKFWYVYVNPKYGENAKCCYMDTESFIFHVNTEDTYKDIAEDVEISFSLQILKQTDYYLKEKTKK